MWTHWNPRCSPPWSAEDEYEHLRQKAENGYRYATSQPGNITPAYRITSAARLFQPVVTDTEKGGKESRVGRFRAVDRAAMQEIKPASMLVRDLIPAGAYALLVGAPGSLKTFVALDIAHTVASGFGPVWEAVECGAVLFAVGEGRSGVKQRVEAWEREHRGGALSENFVLIDPVPAVDAGENEWTAFIQTAKGIRPEGYKLIVLDTVGRAMQGINENAQEHASKFTKLVERLQRELGGAVLGLHHTGHEAKDRARGSSVFGADADTVLRLDREDKARVVTLTMLKQKDAPEWEQPKVLKLAEVQLLPGVSSLAVTAPTAADVKQAQASHVERDETPAAQDLNARFILAALRSRMAKTWGKTELAEAARTHGCRIPLETLRRALGRHRGNLGWATRHPALTPYFNAAGERWAAPLPRNLPPIPPGFELDDNVPLPANDARAAS